MRIGMIVGWLNPNLTAAVEILRERGAAVELIRPEEQALDLAAVRVQNDLYIIKSGTPLAMSLAGTLHALGTATLNPYPTVALLRDKLIVTRLLQHAGIPTPETYVTTSPQAVAPLLSEGPLILKPHQGSRGRGVRIVTSADELDAIPADGPLLAQRYHRPDGRDHKIYRIGAELFGVRRPWPLSSYEDKTGEPYALSPELREIALKIGGLFGIDLYGCDVVVSEGRPYVVDVDKFGSTMGVPDAPRRLADYIYAAAERAVHGRPLRNAPLSL
jgi:ribosomal protein S6--L-glutamate ligase